MKKLRIAVVEDSQEQIEKLKRYIHKFSEEKAIAYELSEFHDGDEITDDYKGIYDVIFLDIDMARVDGMKAAKTIRKYDEEAIIIFITNMVQYAIEGYQVEAQSFLVKPLPYFAFYQEMERALQKIENKKTSHILINSENGTFRIDVRDIQYVESDKHRLIFHTKDGEYSMVGTLKDLQKRLEGENFYRSNSCYLVNLERVEGIEDDYAIVDGERLKISRPRKKGFIQTLTNYIGEK